MSVVTVPGHDAPRDLRRPLYSPRRYRRARISVFILALLGLMTFAAVGVMTGQCRTHDNCLLINEGNCLLIGGKPRDALLINGTQTRQAQRGEPAVGAHRGPRAVPERRIYP